MVTFSNGCVSGDPANKRPLENGNVPKYKPRKVSAVRDFPAMCGRNFVPTHKNPEQNDQRAAGSKEDLGFKNFESIDPVMANGATELAEASKLNDVKKSSVVVGSFGVGNSSEALCQTDAVRSDEDVDMAEQIDAPGESNLLGNEFPKEDTVDNPLELENIGSLDALVGNVMMTTTVDGFLNNDENLITEIQLVGVDKQNEVKNDSYEGPLLRNSQVQVSSPGGILSKTFSRPKDKYRKRRVSAVRDFPLHCGRFALPPESENLMVNAKVEGDHDVKEVLVKTSQKECQIKSVDVDVKNETGLLYNDEEKPPGEKMGHIKEGESMAYDECSRKTVPESQPVANTSNENTEKLPFKGEIAPSLPDLVWAPRSGFNTGNELCREIIHALAAPDSQFWKGTVTSNSTGSGIKAQNQNLSRETNKAADLRSTVKANNSGGDENPGSCALKDEENNGTADDEGSHLITPISVCPPVIDNGADSTGKEIVVYSPGQSDEMSHLHHGSRSANMEAVHGGTTAHRTPSRKGKAKIVSSTPNRKASGENNGKENMAWRLRAKAVAKKSAPKLKFLGSSSKKQRELCVNNDVDSKTEDHTGDFQKNPRANRKVMEIEVTLPPRAPRSSGLTDARNKVRETLRLFNAFCRKLLQQDESISTLEDGKSAKKLRRIDLLSARAIKEKGKEVNTEKQYIGHVPGVEVGDEFQYRVELAIVGIHRLYQAGIDSVKVDGGMLICTSIVSSGSYGDDVESADVLLYSGQGGNVVGKCKTPEDQKLERGNLALFNSISKKNPVRVVRGWKEARVLDPLDPKPKMVPMYVYDGLYTVTRYWPEKGPHGKQVFMFELRRNPGQPELAWKELKKTNKFKVRPGMVVSDISGGKESLPICAVNTINDEKPPSFQYISKMMYPEWFKPITPPGCDCIGRCTDSENCRCAVRNGGEVPYNHNGAIVETKPLVYECGPHCKCPPSCYNRVTQRGIKFPLEIFKTQSRGWGVRALTSVPSGSFICEYAGELLEDKEAEKRVGSDEYLFDIGHNYSDSSVMNEEKAALAEHAEGGYTIDAAQFGNIGRFVNHSCSPNLYAQNVIYDHDDKRMPHVMLFAMENLPPLQELTYHYNYSVDQIRDVYGNIKVKECYCGSAECSGRMY